ncbi:alpha/beta fold hydrolase [Nocardia vaccinii]|uniref:alpha/beta fold hydrolase n=1 Tax=Nocardia vaccinii TaxID=1822 RepID=UPI0008372B10|nr:alpha/beta hydrolase [Nocardia vaccinii]
MSAPITTPATRTVTLPTGVPLTITEYGANTDGQAVLMLHSGTGPRTMAGISAALSQHVYVITPTYPGFDGTPRPEGLASVADLAEAYLDLLEILDLSGVMVVGNSVGGWVATEMALRDNHQRIGALVLMNAVGIHAHVPKNRVVDTRTLNPAEVGLRSFANAEFRPDFSALPAEQLAGIADNQKTLAQYGGEHFTYDPGLRGRLHRVTVPVLVVWGEKDGIAPLTYGRGYSEEFVNGHFAPIADAGHFPQVEQLGATLGAIGNFVDTVVKPGVAA